MDPERWEMIKETFEAALELDPAQRLLFLDRQCAGDPSLRAEVLSLLATHESTESFIEKPVYEVAPELFEPSAAKLPERSRIGPYSVIEELGQGGMGIVYLAEDTRLGRRVAMKALAPQFTRNAQYRERLRIEARAAAVLTHPGIATVYALEEFENTLYIITEYVRGETLRAELDRGPMPAPVLVETAIELTQTLVAAHGQGVIHRDLKPENVMRASEGRIKILDFGLARIQANPGFGEPSGPKFTRPGAFLGTPAYASPEQLRGLEVDFRSDIFSLGVLLYEMASGVHPFGGRDSISTIARILEREPEDLARLCPLPSSRLDVIVKRCLNKSPGGRYSSARDLLVDLELLKRDLKDSAIRQPASPRRAEAGSTGTSSAPRPVWWWQFHQVVAGSAYYGMLYPLWKAREWVPGIMGSLLFFSALVAVGVAGNLRFHFWFTSRVYPGQLAEQKRRVFWWVRGADWLFALLLAATAIALQGTHAFWAALHLGAAIGCLVGFLIIEPATTRAALGDDWDEEAAGKNERPSNS